MGDVAKYMVDRYGHHVCQKCAEVLHTLPADVDVTDWVHAFANARVRWSDHEEREQCKRVWKKLVSLKLVKGDALKTLKMKIQTAECQWGQMGDYQ